MEDEALTNSERDQLRAAGYVYAGGGADPLTGRPYLKFTRNGETTGGSRAVWRAVIADIKPPTEDEIAFGKDAWVYCRQHMKAHETGWCGVGVRDKVALGVNNAEAATTKCREWGFELYYDLYPNG